MTLQKIFIENLKKFRKEAGLSQANLAAMSQLSTGMIGQIESGIAFPSINSFERISRAVNVDAYKFFIDPTQKIDISDAVVEEMIDKIRDTIKKAQGNEKD